MLSPVKREQNITHPQGKIFRQKVRTRTAQETQKGSLRRKVELQARQDTDPRRRKHPQVGKAHLQKSILPKNSIAPM